MSATKILRTSLLVVVAVLALTSAVHSLEFSEFVTKGYEGKAELEFIAPEDLILGPAGEIIVADQKNNRVQILKADGSFARFISSKNNGVDLPPPGDERPGRGHKAKHAPKSSDKPGDKKVPADKKTVVAPSGESGFVWYGEGASMTITLGKPVGLALDKSGRLWVSCSEIHKIYIFRFADGKALGEFGQRGRQQGLFDTPMDIDIRSDGFLAVADWGNKRVQIFSPSGKSVREIHYKEETKKAGLRDIRPRGVFWDIDGNLLVSYPAYNQIVCWNLTGALVWRYGVLGNDKGELNQPSYFCPSLDGNIMLSDSGNNRIVEVNPRGILIRNYPIRRGTGPGKLLSPRGLALVKPDTLVVADQGNNRVHFFKPGKAIVLLREAESFAKTDHWDEAFSLIEQVLNLHPNNREASSLMVNALHFFGDRSFQKADFDKSEEFFRRVLIYQPNDPLVPKKLDAIFWAENRYLIVKLAFGIMGVIAALILSWVARTTFNKLVFGHP